MTRNTGQLTTRQAILGALAILAVVLGIVAALALLLEREERSEPLEAPAEPADAENCPPTPEAVVNVTADELIECPETYDRQVVRYRGEAVRAVLRRGDRAWVHLNDDPYALDIGPLPVHRTAVGGNSGIPVSIPIDVADQISHVGDGRHRGDILDIVGTYQRADPDDDGGPTIQASSARIHQAGHPLTRPVSRRRIITAITVALLAVVSTAAAHFRGTTPSTGGAGLR